MAEDLFAAEPIYFQKSLKPDRRIRIKVKRSDSRFNVLKGYTPVKASKKRDRPLLKHAGIAKTHSPMNGLLSQGSISHLFKKQHEEKTMTPRAQLNSTAAFVAKLRQEAGCGEAPAKAEKVSKPRLVDYGSSDSDDSSDEAPKTPSSSRNRSKSLGGSGDATTVLKTPPSSLSYKQTNGTTTLLDFPKQASRSPLKHNGTEDFSHLKTNGNSSSKQEQFSPIKTPLKKQTKSTEPEEGLFYNGFAKTEEKSSNEDVYRKTNGNSAPKKEINGNGAMYGPELPPKLSYSYEEDKPTSSNSKLIQPQTIVNGFKKLVPQALLKKQRIQALDGQKESSNGSYNANKENGLQRKFQENGNIVERKNGEHTNKRVLDQRQDGPPAQRKRLLSERGEEERKHPMIDRTMISHWRWSQANKIGHRRFGCGLLNHMNDCFLNACLQIVVHTAPLAKFIDTHSRCRGDPCLLCVLRTHLYQAFNATSPFTSSLLKYTRLFFKSHHRGHQEDAHEAFLHLLDGIDGISHPGMKPASRTSSNDNLSTMAQNASSKSTPSEQIFGMTVRYRGQCRQCGKDSNGYERLRVLELGLDKWRPTDSQELLQRFFRTEQLNDYKCEKCGIRGAYVRTAQLLRPPAVLVLLIARFAFLRKVREPVMANSLLDLQQYIVDPQGYSHGDCQYRLRGVIDHLGLTLDSGHYRAFHVDVTGENWYEFDDEMVRRTDERNVRNETANGCYLLVYHRKSNTN